MLDAFLRYRFDYPALALDTVRVVLSGTYAWHRRLLAILGPGVVLAIYPAYLLVFGHGNFGGNAWTLALGAFSWAVTVEAPGWLHRQSLAAGTPSDAGFDWFLLITFSIVDAGSLAVAYTVAAHHGSEFRGFMWGIALVGLSDLARTTVALILVGGRGYPLYVRRAVTP